MHMTSVLEHPELWRARAAEARALVNGLEDLEARKAMLDIAQSYEKLALRAEARRRDQP
jgi:hypothetical protein